MSQAKPGISYRLVLRQIGLAGLVVTFIILNFIKQLLLPIYRVFFAARHPVVVRTPEERFISARVEDLGYNFKPHYIEIMHGASRPRLHYIDERPFEEPKGTILCLHGEPTWSFLYRKMIPLLTAAGYRVIVPDFIGFGKSDKYVDPENYNHEFHMMCIRNLLKELNIVSDLTLVCQDWGGLVGLSVVKEMPKAFKSLVIMNTGLPIGIEQGDALKHPLQVLGMSMPFLLWRSFVMFFGTNLPLDFIFRRVAKFPPVVVNAYTAPHPSSLYKGGAAKWPLLVPLYRDDSVAQHMLEARNNLKSWRKPALVMFGDKDPITRGQDRIFMDLLPHAKSVSVQGASHFLQETHPSILCQNIVNFLQTSK